MVTELIAAGQLTLPISTSADIPNRLAQSIQILHSSKSFENDFNIFHLADNCLSTALKYKFDLPKSFVESNLVLKRFQSTLEAKAMTKVPCHNDLIAENIIDDGIHLRFVDVEDPGNIDPCSIKGVRQFLSSSLKIRLSSLSSLTLESLKFIFWHDCTFMGVQLVLPGLY